MNQEEAITKIKSKISEIETLKRLPRFCPEFKKWSRETNVLLSQIFGADSYQQRDFEKIDFVFHGVRRLDDDSPIERRYRTALQESCAILTSIFEEIEEYGLSCDVSSDRDPTIILDMLFSRFHTVVRQLRNRHASRQTLDVADEYDVQDLLHCLLKIHFLDVRPEEWTPSYAGSSSRMDFLLHKEEIVIEVKMTRHGITDRVLADQLIIDIARYEAHPKCKILICFVYDPEGRVGNPSSIITDLEKHSSSIPIRIYIKPEIV